MSNVSRVPKFEFLHHLGHKQKIKKRGMERYVTPPQLYGISIVFFLLIIEPFPKPRHFSSNLDIGKYAIGGSSVHDWSIQYS